MAASGDKAEIIDPTAAISAAVEEAAAYCPAKCILLHR